MSTLAVDGADLFYECIGTGPALVMLHGGLGIDHTYFRPWHDALADHARVVYYDLRGNGRSTRRGSLNHRTWHADTIALLDALGERRAIIYGHSYGAWLALGLALEYPERIAGLVLCGAGPSLDRIDAAVTRAQMKNPELAAKLVAGLSTPLQSDAEAGTLWNEILPLYFVGEPRPAMLSNTIFCANALTAGNEAMAGFDPLPRLSTIEAPVLVLNGRHDFLMPPSEGSRIAEHVRHGELHVFERSGHFPFIEEPAEYVARVRSWLETRMPQQ